MKIAFGGGGTGGHIVPALAIAECLKQLGHEALFIGNRNSIEERLVRAENYQFQAIKVQKLYRSFSFRNLLFPFYLVGSIISSCRILKHENPDAVFVTGGFVAGPVALSAIILRIPVYGHESNSYPGLVTRTLAKYFRHIYISFESSRKYLPQAKLSNFGIPLKSGSESSFLAESIGLVADKPIIIVSGGSQGSLAINNAIESIIPDLINKGYQLIWQTGRTTYNKFADKFKPFSGLYLFDFSPDYINMLSVAKLAITRAGAMTIAELEENRVPSILIPLPSAAENHQYFNALEQQEKGVSLLLEQFKLTPETLINAIEIVVSNVSEYKAKLEGLPQNQATQKITNDLLIHLVKSGNK
ncbi:MAG: undecaprenyldiphospho-muramoylpentapeptide beta-N-acetylglucosaminyltransferase [Candidatus Cloacimonetes bacterium]|nr:undecaprenyldiphospho-muramoylpentapeptide beta-N-acetylglucosaminyltransferase [Candidatus Cloacimonadota bacterium]